MAHLNSPCKHPNRGTRTMRRNPRKAAPQGSADAAQHRQTTPHHAQYARNGNQNQGHTATHLFAAPHRSGRGKGESLPEHCASHLGARRCSKTMGKKLPPPASPPSRRSTARRRLWHEPLATGCPVEKTNAGSGTASQTTLNI